MNSTDALRVLAELSGDRRELGERHRAHVGTVRVAEKNHHYLAFELRERARLAGVIGQADVAPEVGPRDIGEFERRPAGRRIAASEHHCQHHESRRREAFHAG